MKKISITELNKLTANTALLAGSPVSYGGNIYMAFALPGGTKWINWLPYDKYMTASDKYNASPEGWYALLRVA